MSGKDRGCHASDPFPGFRDTRPADSAGLRVYGLRSLRLFRITRLQSAEQTPKSRFAQGSLDLASRDPAFKPFVNHAPATSLSMGRPRYGRWTHDRDMDELRRGCGKVRLLVPDETSMGRPTPVRVDMVSTVSALQAHIETLKVELAASEARVDKLSIELAGERTARQADQDQLAVARAAADKATAELVELARRLAAIAETQTSAEPEQPRHWAIRAWRWMQKTA